MYTSFSLPVGCWWTTCKSFTSLLLCCAISHDAICREQEGPKDPQELLHKYNHTHNYIIHLPNVIYFLVLAIIVLKLINCAEVSFHTVVDLVRLLELTLRTCTLSAAPALPVQPASWQPLPALCQSHAQGSEFC